MSTDDKTPAQAPKPGTPEYDAHMAAVADAGGAHIRVPTDPTNPTQTAVIEPAAAGTAPEGDEKAQRPDWCPEKFWDADKGEVRTEAMARSYADAERKISKPGLTDPTKSGKSAAAQAPAAPEKTAEQKAAEAELAAATTDEAKAAAQAKLDTANAAAKAPQTPAMSDIVSKASQEYAETGEISAESYAALEAQGLSREYVDTYVDGMKARAEVITTKVYSEAGGEEQYGAIRQWAEANLSAEEVAAANAVFASGDLDATLGQVRSLVKAYKAATGTVGSRIDGQLGPGGVSAVAPFQNKTEVTMAMADSRYRNDAGYRAGVEKRIAASIKANIDLGF